MQKNTVSVPWQDLWGFTRDVFLKVGLSPEDAEIEADVLGQMIEQADGKIGQERAEHGGQDQVDPVDRAHPAHGHGKDHDRP